MAASVSTAGAAAAPFAAGGALIGAAIGAVEGWAGGSLIDNVRHMGRRRAVSKSRGDNARPNTQFDRIAERYNLNPEGRRVLHEAISDQDLAGEEIDMIAEDLARHAKYLKRIP